MLLGRVFYYNNDRTLKGSEWGIIISVQNEILRYDSLRWQQTET